MGTVVDVLVKLRTDSSDMDRGLNKGAARAQQFGRHMRDAGAASQEAGGKMGRAGTIMSGALGVFTGGAALTGVMAVGNGLKALGTMGIAAASDQQQAMIAFEHMLGSQKKAADFYKQLADVAAKTPFEMQDMVLGTKRLMGFGFESQKSIKMLTAMGDAASGLSTGPEGIQSMTMAFGQMHAKGKIATGELTQLASSGVPALQYLADTFGVTTAQMSDMVSKGLIPADQGIDAIVQGMDKGTKNAKGFGGMMEAQSSTLQGVWSTFTDTVRMGLADALMPYIPTLAKIVSAATPLVGGVLTGLMQGFAGLIGLLAKLGPIFSPVVQGFLDFKAGLIDFKGPIDGVTGPLNTLGLGIRAFIAAVKDPDITSNGLVGMFEALGSAVRAAYDAVMPVLTAIAGFIMAQVVPSLMRLGPPIMEFITTIATGMIPILNTMKDVWLNNILPALSMFWAMVDGIVIPVIIILFKVVGTLIGWLLKAIPPILRIAGPVLQSLIVSFTFAIGIVMAVVRVIATLISWFVSAAGAIGRFAVNAIAAIGRFHTFVAGIKAKVVGAMNTSKTWLVSAGKNIVQGLWDGVQAMGGWIAGKVKGFVTSHITGPIKSALHISSPSKVGHWIGQMVPQGIARGILADAPLVSGAAKVVAQNALPSIAPTSAAVAGGGGGNSPQTIEFVSDGTELGRLLLEIIRKSVRARGGNVQVVLGAV